MTWMMPLLAITSGWITVAVSLMTTLPSTTEMAISAPLKVAAVWPSRLMAVAASTLPRRRRGRSGSR